MARTVTPKNLEMAVWPTAGFLRHENADAASRREKTAQQLALVAYCLNYDGVHELVFERQ